MLLAAGLEGFEPSYGPVDKATFDPDTYVPGVYYTLVDGEYQLATGAFDATVQYYFQTSSITTLEEYFCHLKNIYDLPARKDKFLMLPLDEEMFEINADTRTITIPPNFRKAGIGVQGDVIAETLLFKVNRFFDTMDFNNCDIFVQWEGPAAAGQDPVQYVYPVTMIDIETYADEGKMVFGWPVSENLTATSGNIKFSVRFIKTDASNKVVYSFSTLTAQAVINPGLNFDFNTARHDDMVNSLFEQIIENSEASIGISAVAPTFIASPDDKVYLAELSGDDNKGKYKGTLEYSVAVSDLGDVTYKWYRKPNADAARIYLGVEDGTALPNHAIKKDYRPAATPLSASKNYFEKINNTTWVRYAGDIASADASNLYERYTVLTISGALNDINPDGSSKVTGLYFVEAVNRLGSREKTARSKVVECPAPTNPQITTNLPAATILDKDTGLATLTIAYTKDAQAQDDVVWLYSTNKETWTTAVNDEGQPLSTGKSISVDDVGYYKADVNSVMNLGRATSSTAIGKVTNLPVAPEFADLYKDAALDRVIDKKIDRAITVERKENDIGVGELYSERVEYVWKGNRDKNNNEISNEDSFVEYARTNEPTLPIPTDYSGPDQIVCYAINYLSNKTATSEKSCRFVIV